ncbi:MAG TPA: hypothetical protein EYP08_04220, partial [Pyrodictiaceae archaeon]|nr:hypothetical protein [Pyrodictiaceae archaeon]
SIMQKVLIFEKPFQKAECGRKSVTGCLTVVAIGDGENDVEFVEAGFRTYAVANADKKLKRVAHEIIPAPSSQGVKLFIQKLYRQHLLNQEL